MRWLQAVVLLAGCGRVGFDVPNGDAPADVAVDGSLESSLVVWLPFDDDPADGIENRAPGGPTVRCATTCPQWMGGIRQDSYFFDGSSHALEIADAPRLRAARGTIALYVFLDTLPAPDAYYLLLGKALGPESDNSYELYVHQGAALRVGGGGDAGAMSSYPEDFWTASTTGWAHVALTWDETFRLYVDGTLRDERAAFPLVFDERSVFIGADLDQGALGGFLHGKLDDVRVYDRELTAIEIAALAEP